MFAEPSERHRTPHFHAYYQERVAVFSISPVALIAGSIPQRQQRLVEAWASCTRTNCWLTGIFSIRESDLHRSRLCSRLFL